MSMKTCKTAVCASALMAVAVWSGGVFAAAGGISQNFETSKTGIEGAGGTLGAGTPTTPTCGRPGTIGANAQVLAVTGTVSYTEASTPDATGISQVDLMFKAEPTDELDALESDVKVALAVITNSASEVSLKLWCKATSSAAADWLGIGNVSSGAWKRATIVLNYGKELCQISIDGDPVVKGNDGSDWYTGYFAKGSDTYLNSVTMVGSTEVDDFVVSHTTAAAYTEPYAEVEVAGTTSGITYGQLNEYGITVAQVQGDPVLNADSGLKVSEKLAAGLNPKSDTKFELQTMTTTKSQAVITFPGANATSRYGVKVKDASNNVIATDTTITQAGDGEKINTATIDLTGHEDELLYFTVETVTP